MKDVSYVIKKGRFKTTFWDFFFIGIILFAIMSFSLISIIHIENSDTKYFLVLFTFIFLIMISFLYARILLKKNSFEFYINYSKNTNESIIEEISQEFCLTLYRQNQNIFHSFYYYSPQFLKFNTKKEIYFIQYNNTIMVNIRNADDTIVFNLFKDNKSIEIKKLLEIKTNKFEIKPL